MRQAKLYETDGLMAGVDEAGRGTLAGPVVASAVVLNPQIPIAGLADSKKLTPIRRDVLAAQIKQHSLAWSVAWADPAEIDVLNILVATMLAMRRAIIALTVTPGTVQVDGNRLPDMSFERGLIPGKAIIGGDDIVPAISAASIVAKTTRDRMMRSLDKIYPHYEFARHKGYGTELHRERLREFGPCTEHRKSFAPVRAVSR
jgi:ribonuclease HII